MSDLPSKGSSDRNSTKLMSSIVPSSSGLTMVASSSNAVASTSPGATKTIPFYPRLFLGVQQPSSGLTQSHPGLHVYHSSSTLASSPSSYIVTYSASNQSASASTPPGSTLCSFLTNTVASSVNGSSVSIPSQLRSGFIQAHPVYTSGHSVHPCTAGITSASHSATSSCAGSGRQVPLAATIRYTTPIINHASASSIASVAQQSAGPTSLIIVPPQSVQVQACSGAVNTGTTPDAQTQLSTHHHQVFLLPQSQHSQTPVAQPSGSTRLLVTAGPITGTRPVSATSFLPVSTSQLSSPPSAQANIVTGVANTQSVTSCGIGTLAPVLPVTGCKLAPLRVPLPTGILLAGPLLTGAGSVTSVNATTTSAATTATTVVTVASESISNSSSVTSTQQGQIQAAPIAVTTNLPPILSCPQLPHHQHHSLQHPHTANTINTTSATTIPLSTTLPAPRPLTSQTAGIPSFLSTAPSLISTTTVSTVALTSTATTIGAVSAQPTLLPVLPTSGLQASGTIPCSLTSAGQVHQASPAAVFSLTPGGLNLIGQSSLVGTTGSGVPVLAQTQASGPILIRTSTDTSVFSSLITSSAALAINPSTRPSNLPTSGLSKSTFGSEGPYISSQPSTDTSSLLCQPGTSNITSIVSTSAASNSSSSATASASSSPALSAYLPQTIGRTGVSLLSAAAACIVRPVGVNATFSFTDAGTSGISGGSGPATVTTGVLRPGLSALNSQASRKRSRKQQLFSSIASSVVPTSVSSSLTQSTPVPIDHAFATGNQSTAMNLPGVPITGAALSVGLISADAQHVHRSHQQQQHQHSAVFTNPASSAIIATASVDALPSQQTPANAGVATGLPVSLLSPSSSLSSSSGSQTFVSLASLQTAESIVSRALSSSGAAGSSASSMTGPSSTGSAVGATGSGVVGIRLLTLRASCSPGFSGTSSSSAALLSPAVVTSASGSGVTLAALNVEANATTIPADRSSTQTFLASSVTGPTSGMFISESGASVPTGSFCQALNASTGVAGASTFYVLPGQVTCGMSAVATTTNSAALNSASAGLQARSLGLGLGIQSQVNAITTVSSSGYSIISTPSSSTGVLSPSNLTSPIASLTTNGGLVQFRLRSPPAQTGSVPILLATNPSITSCSFGASSASVASSATSISTSITAAHSVSGFHQLNHSSGAPTEESGVSVGQSVLLSDNEEEPIIDVSSKLQAAEREPFSAEQFGKRHLDSSSSSPFLASGVSEMSGSPVAKRSRSALCQPQSSASGSIMSEESGRLRVSASLRLTDTNQERVAFGSDTKDSSLSEHRQVDFRHDQQQSTHLRSLQTSPVSSPSPGVPQHANHDQKQPKNYQYNQHFRIRQSAYHSHSGNSDASEDDHAENEIDGDALKTVSFRTSTCTDQTPMTKRLIRLGQNSGERVDLARFRSDSSITRQASVAPRQPGISSGRKIDPASEGVEDDLVVEEERGVNTSCDERHFRLVNSKRSLQDFEANHREWVGLMNEKERLVNRPILEVVSEWSGDETIIKANEDQSRHDWRHSIRQLANANADKNECACVLEGKLCVEESGDKDDEEEVLFSDHISSKTNNHRYSDIRDCPLIPCLRPIRPLKAPCYSHNADKKVFSDKQIDNSVEATYVELTHDQLEDISDVEESGSPVSFFKHKHSCPTLRHRLDLSRSQLEGNELLQDEDQSDSLHKVEREETEEYEEEDYLEGEQDDNEICCVDGTLFETQLSKRACLRNRKLCSVDESTLFHSHIGATQHTPGSDSPNTFFGDKVTGTMFPGQPHSQKRRLGLLESSLEGVSQAAGLISSKFYTSSMALDAGPSGLRSQSHPEQLQLTSKATHFLSVNEIRIRPDPPLNGPGDLVAWSMGFPPNGTIPSSNLDHSFLNPSYSLQQRQEQHYYHHHHHHYHHHHHHHYTHDCQASSTVHWPSPTPSCPGQTSLHGINSLPPGLVDLVQATANSLFHNHQTSGTVSAPSNRVNHVASPIVSNGLESCLASAEQLATGGGSSSLSLNSIQSTLSSASIPISSANASATLPEPSVRGRRGARSRTTLAAAGIEDQPSSTAGGVEEMSCNSSVQSPVASGSSSNPTASVATVPGLSSVGIGSCDDSVLIVDAVKWRQLVRDLIAIRSRNLATRFVRYPVDTCSRLDPTGWRVLISLNNIDHLTGVESHGLSEITLLQHRLSSLSDRMDHKVESSTPLAINTLCQSSRPASCCSFALDHPSPLSINEFSWQHQQQQQPYSNSLKCSSASSGNQIRSTEVSFYNFGHSSPAKLDLKHLESSTISSPPSDEISELPSSDLLRLSDIMQDLCKRKQLLLQRLQRLKRLTRQLIQEYRPTAVRLLYSHPSQDLLESTLTPDLSCCQAERPSWLQEVLQSVTAVSPGAGTNLDGLSFGIHNTQLSIGQSIEPDEAPSRPIGRCADLIPTETSLYNFDEIECPTTSCHDICSTSILGDSASILPFPPLQPPIRLSPISSAEVSLKSPPLLSRSDLEDHLPAEFAEALSHRAASSEENTEQEQLEEDEELEEDEAEEEGEEDQEREQEEDDDEEDEGEEEEEEEDREEEEEEEEDEDEDEDVDEDEEEEEEEYEEEDEDGREAEEEDVSREKEEELGDFDNNSQECPSNAVVSDSGFKNHRKNEDSVFQGYLSSDLLLPYFHSKSYKKVIRQPSLLTSKMSLILSDSLPPPIGVTSLVNELETKSSSLSVDAHCSSLIDGHNFCIGIKEQDLCLQVTDIHHKHLTTQFSVDFYPNSSFLSHTKQTFLSHLMCFCPAPCQADRSSSNLTCRGRVLLAIASRNSEVITCAYLDHAIRFWQLKQ